MYTAKKIRRRNNGDGSLVKRRNHYYHRLNVDGRQIETPLKNEDQTPCTTKEQAQKAFERLKQRQLLELDTEEKLVQKIAEIRQLKVECRARSCDVWQLYINSAERPDTGEKTLKTHRVLLERFEKWLQEHYHMGLDSATAVVASAFMHELGETVSNKTFDDYLAILRLIYRTVHAQLGMKENPFADIRHRPSETVCRKDFTEEQVRMIFEGFRTGFFYESEEERLGPGRRRIRERIRREYKPLYKDEMEVLMKLCCYTGCDGKSGCLMKWENIDLDGGQIHYVRTKTSKKTNGRVITLPIHDVLRAALVKAVGWRQPDSPYVLPNVSRRYLANCTCVQKDAMKIIGCALGVPTTTYDYEGKKRARGANVYSLHSFRHTFASLCANAGVPLATIGEIIGHGSTAMTRHYTHLNDAAKLEAMKALPMLPTEMTIGKTGACDAENPATPGHVGELTSKCSEALARAFSAFLHESGPTGIAAYLSEGRKIHSAMSLGETGVEDGTSESEKRAKLIEAGKSRSAS